MEPREPVARGDDVLRRLVGEVERVCHDPHVVETRLGEQRERVGERADEAGGVALRRVDGLEAEHDSGLPRGRRRASHALDHDRAALILRAPAERPAEAEHACRLVRRQAPDRVADRLDPLLRVRRALHPRDREGQERRHGRDAVRHREPPCAEQLDVRRVVGGQLELPEADRVEPCGGVGVDVLGEGRVDRRDRREGEPHRLAHRLVSDFKSDTLGSFESTRRVSGGFVSSFATR